jgi:hypothetical protein
VANAYRLDHHLDKLAHQFKVSVKNQINILKIQQTPPNTQIYWEQEARLRKPLGTQFLEIKFLSNLNK